MSFNIEIEKLKEKTIDELDSYLKKYEEDQKNRYNNSKTELELFWWRWWCECNLNW